MIVVGFILAIAFGFGAGWSWRHFDPNRKEVKSLFSRLLDKYALGGDSVEVQLLRAQLRLKNEELRAAQLKTEAAKIVKEVSRKPGTNNHLCHDSRCQGFGAPNHYCHDGDCGRVAPSAPGKGRTNTCPECGAPPNIPCWEERHKRKQKKEKAG